MSIFGEKCDRCGEKTRNKQGDTPVCKTCEEEMTLLMEASEESKRLCPSDGAEMTKVVAHMIVIDRCPQCQGVWLDSGELEKVWGNASSEAIIAMSRGFSAPYG